MLIVDIENRGTSDESEYLRYSCHLGGLLIPSHTTTFTSIHPPIANPMVGRFKMKGKKYKISARAQCYRKRQTGPGG